MREETLWLYDNIGFDGWTTGKVRASLNHFKRDSAPETLNIRIASQGGDVIEMNGIIAAIKEFKAETGVYVRTIIDVIAASAAADISLAVSDEILTQEMAPILVHKSWGMVVGGSDDFRRVADEMDAIDKQGIDLIVAKTGMSPEDALEITKQDRLIYPPEAIQLKMVDGLYQFGGVDIERLEAYKAKLEQEEADKGVTKMVKKQIDGVLDAHYTEQRVLKAKELYKKLGGA